MRRLIILLFCLALSRLAAAATEKKKSSASIDWREWSDEIFAQAEKEHRFVLLDLGAVWCHWCHVMEEITYRDPKVIALIKSATSRCGSIKIRGRTVESVRRLRLARDGRVQHRRQRDCQTPGYIPPKPMASMLQAIIDDPSPGPSIVAEAPVEPNRDGELTAGAEEPAQDPARQLRSEEPRLGHGAKISQIGTSSSTAGRGDGAAIANSNAWPGRRSMRSAN